LIVKVRTRGEIFTLRRLIQRSVELTAARPPLFRRQRLQRAQQLLDAIAHQLRLMQSMAQRR
jgi:hypothetical protein